MQVSPFGFVLIFWTLYCIQRERYLIDTYISLWGLAFIVEGGITAGVFMQSGSFSLSYGDYFQIVLMLFSIILIIKNRHNISICPIIFILLVAINLIILAENPLNAMVRSYEALDRSLEYYSYDDIYIYPQLGLQSIKTGIRFVVYIINALCLSMVIDEFRWSKIVNRYITFWKFILKYLLLEFVSKNIIHWYGYITVLDWFFGSNGTMMKVSGIHRNGLSVLLGFNSEPSHLLMVIIPFLIVYVLSDIDENDLHVKYRYILFSFVLCFLSGSFRAVGMIPIVLLFMMIKYRKNATLYGIISIMCIAVFFLGSVGAFNYIFERLLSVVVDYNSNNYFTEGRLNTIAEAFSIFEKRPLVGCGLGTAFAYGFIPSILETFGLIGTIYWYRIMFFRIAHVNFIRHGYVYMILLTIMWLYTNAISTGYMATTLLICLAISYSQGEVIIDNQEIQDGTIK